MIAPPFNLQQWINDNRHLLKPPVGNRQIYLDNADYIVMVVSGPNSRKDYHYNEGEELFYQLEGDIIVRIQENGAPRDIQIKAGEMFLLPPKVPHSPQRPSDSVGLVIERYRRENENDGFQWFCENCNNLLHEEYFVLTDIVKQLPEVMKNFYNSPEKRTCKKCEAVMDAPLASK